VARKEKVIYWSFLGGGEGGGKEEEAKGGGGGEVVGMRAPLQRNSGSGHGLGGGPLRGAINNRSRKPYIKAQRRIEPILTGCWGGKTEGKSDLAEQEEGEGRLPNEKKSRTGICR